MDYVVFLFSILYLTLCTTASPINTPEIENEISTRDDDPYRLPDTVSPQNYTISLKLEEDFGPAGTFEGNVSINFVTNSEVQDIILHAYLLEIGPENITLTCNNDVTNLFSSYSNSTTYRTLTITATEAIPSGSECTLTVLNYQGYLTDDMAGFYRSSYTNADGETEWLATTQFQTVSARRAFPCFDEPKFKATFQITIYHPPDYTAISNTANVSWELDGDYQRTEFNTTPVMSTYLIAFVVSKFTYLQSTVLDYYRVFAREEAIDTANYTLYIAPPLVETLENFTNIPYLDSGIGKLDQIAVPDFSAGAMENWGLITYRERNLLWDPAHSSNSYKQAIAAVIAHELAHMWFGNLVTCEWWSYTWLNEGFARYFQYFGTGEVETTWDMDKQFVVAQHQVIFASDAVDSAVALTSNASTFSEISNKFSSISYNKGASVIRMMEHFLGYDNFKSGIQSYLSAHKFDTAVPQDLFDALSPYASNLPEGRSFDDVMITWTEQPGFPVVNIEMSGVDAVLTQNRFYLNSSFSSDLKWDIPISYTISHSPDFETTSPSLWFPATSDSVTIENILHGGTGWVVLNIQETAYYRVNYDSTLWSALESALKSEDFDGIPELNRAQIVDDALNLARAGQLDYSTALNIVSYLENETSYYPWYSALSALTVLNRRIGSLSTLGDYFKAYITTLLTNVIDSVPFDTNDDDDQIYTLKKAMILSWACRFEIGDCVSKSVEAFNNYQYNNVSINANLRSVVYCNALRHAENSDSWYFLWQTYLDSKLSTEEVTILTALGCTTNETLLTEYLLKTISDNSDIRYQDLSTVYASIYGNREGVPVLFNFLKSYYNVLPNYYSSWSGLFSYVAERFSTQEEIDELQDFLDTYSDELSSSVQSTIQSALDTASSNLEWTNTFATQLTSYFARGAAANIKINFALAVFTTVVLFVFRTA